MSDAQRQEIERLRAETAGLKQLMLQATSIWRVQDEAQRARIAALEDPMDEKRKQALVNAIAAVAPYASEEQLAQALAVLTSSAPTLAAIVTPEAAAPAAKPKPKRLKTKNNDGTKVLLLHPGAVQHGQPAGHPATGRHQLHQAGWRPGDVEGARQGQAPQGC